jgi:hypothetical protein
MPVSAWTAAADATHDAAPAPQTRATVPTICAADAILVLEILVMGVRFSSLRGGASPFWEGLTVCPIGIIDGNPVKILHRRAGTSSSVGSSPWCDCCAPLSRRGWLEVVSNAVAAFDSDSMDPRVAGALRCDRVDFVDCLPGVHPARELHRSALAGGLGRFRCVAVGVHDCYCGARLLPNTSG